MNQNLAIEQKIATDVQQTLRVLHNQSDCFEIRIPEFQVSKKFACTYAGYYGRDRIDDAARDAAGAVGNAHATYVTLNPALADLRARSSTLKRSKHATSDGDIVRRRWLLIDFDPIRIAGVSSTDDEKNAAQAVAVEVRDWLRDEYKWRDPVCADSGNGYHLLYPIDLPNDDESLLLVNQVLHCVATQFGTEEVDVDTAVGNASRITKLYGTFSRKGEHTDDRPHRRSRLVKVPDDLNDNGWSADATVSLEQLSQVAHLHADSYKSGKTAKSKSEVEPGERYTGGGESKVQRCWSYLRRLPESVQGENGSGIMFRAACICVEFDLDDEQGPRMLRRWSDENAQPPWSEREIQHKWADACREADRGAKLQDVTELGAGAIRISEVTDAKIAELFAGQHADKLVYCHDTKRWYSYRDGRFSDAKASVDVQEGLLATVRGLPSVLVGEERRGKKVVTADDVVLKYESASAISSVETIARKLREVSGELAEFDESPTLLNLQNGTLDLSKKPVAFREHSPKDRLTKQCNVAYDADAESELWERFLRKILVDPATDKPSDELYDFMQVYLGSFLSGKVELQAVGIMWGSGNNGKSTLIETLCEILGDYAVNPSSDLLLAKRGNSSGQANPEMMTLRGARMAACQEIDKGKQLDEATVKLLTGGDTLSSRPLYGGQVQWSPTHQIMLATNNKPVVTGGDVGIWRRIKLIPFAYEIKDSELVSEFKSLLIEEAPGILNWLIEGYQRFQDGELSYPKIVEIATDEYKGDSDLIGRFVDELCVSEPPTYAQNGNALYSVYATYATSHSETVVGRSTFYEEMEKKGFTVRRRGKGKTVFGLRPIAGLALIAWKKQNNVDLTQQERTEDLMTTGVHVFATLALADQQWLIDSGAVSFSDLDPDDQSGFIKAGGNLF